MASEERERREYSQMSPGKTRNYVRAFLGWGGGETNSDVSFIIVVCHRLLMHLMTT